MSCAKMLQETVVMAFIVGVLTALVCSAAQWWFALIVAFVSGGFLKVLADHAKSIGVLADREDAA